MTVHLDRVGGDVALSVGREEYHPVRVALGGAPTGEVRAALQSGGGSTFAKSDHVVIRASSPWAFFLTRDHWPVGVIEN